MARINISVSDELRDALSQRPDINLSAVCQAALLSALDKPVQEHLKLRSRKSRHPWTWLTEAEVEWIKVTSKT